MRNTSQTYHTANEAADVHSDKGKHRHYNGIVFENGALVESFTPDIPAQVDALNDWREPGEQLEGGGFEAAGATLKKLIRWLVQYDSDRRRSIGSIGRRAIALSFVVLGGECGGSWSTMNAAAKELGCTRQSLSKYNRELSELAHGRFARVGFAGGAERAETSRRRLKQWDVRGRLPSAQKRRARAAAKAAWKLANPEKIAANRARQSKLSRKNTLQTPKTP